MRTSDYVFSTIMALKLIYFNIRSHRKVVDSYFRANCITISPSSYAHALRRVRPSWTFSYWVIDCSNMFDIFRGLLNKV